MFTEFRATAWRCVGDARLALTPLHALIGPNDSGKSTLLEGLRRAAQGQPPDTANGTFELRPDVVAGARFVRFSAERLRRASPRVTGSEVALDEDGANLAGVLDAILGRDRGAWAAIEGSTRRLFPTVQRVQLPATNESQKTVAVELHDGTRVPAAAMSEGLLYWLAFCALRHSDRPELLLIEAPENGLHPSRIRDVVAALREVTEQGTQVVLATHSPLVVNELRPDEVSVVTRDANSGTQVRRVSELPDLDRLMSAFSLGELWLAFADGEAEALFRREARG